MRGTSTSFRTFLWAIAVVAAAAASGSAQAAKEAFLSPEQAGPDFQVQGEYVGTIGKQQKLGAQVIALGNGQFEAVLYMGGLPGAGWDGKTRVKLKGKTEGDATHLSGKNFRVTIAKGRLSGTAEQDVPVEAKKIVRKSPTLGAPPPKNAIVLFDGSSVDEWEKGRITEEGLLDVGTRTKRIFKDFTLHIEFRTPFMPKYRGQARGNSGVYLLDQYEVQVLDSFGLEGRDNECGGIYKVAAPRVNMCLPPLSWQTYDIEFTAARFDAQGKKIKNAVVTVKHNGVVIHDHLELPHPTPGGHQNDEKPGRLYLQNHGDPVRYRNIWIIDHSGIATTPAK